MSDPQTPQDPTALSTRLGEHADVLDAYTSGIYADIVEQIVADLRLAAMQLSASPSPAPSENTTHDDSRSDQRDSQREVGLMHSGRMASTSCGDSGSGWEVDRRGAGDPSTDSSVGSEAIGHRTRVQDVLATAAPSERGTGETAEDQEIAEALDYAADHILSHGHTHTARLITQVKQRLTQERERAEKAERNWRSMQTEASYLAKCRDEFKAMWQQLTTEKAQLSRALAADEARLRAAEARVWGEGVTYGCDAADHLADEVLALRAEKAQLEAIARTRLEMLRGLADAARGVEPKDDVLSEAECLALVTDRLEALRADLAAKQQEIDEWKSGHDELCKNVADLANERDHLQFLLEEATQEVRQAFFGGLRAYRDTTGKWRFDGKLNPYPENDWPEALRVYQQQHQPTQESTS